MGKNIVTNVTMQVSQDLFLRVLAIASDAGCDCSSVKDEHFSLYDTVKLSINSYRKLLSGTLQGGEYISAYDFIASQGEQYSLPKFGDEAEFSNYGTSDTWGKRSFCSYIPSVDYKFVDTKGNSWKYMRKIKREPIEQWFNKMDGQLVGGWYDSEDLAKQFAGKHSEQLLMREVV